MRLGLSAHKLLRALLYVLSSALIMRRGRSLRFHKTMYIHKLLRALLQVLSSALITTPMSSLTRPELSAQYEQKDKSMFSQDNSCELSYTSWAQRS